MKEGIRLRFVHTLEKVGIVLVRGQRRREKESGCNWIGGHSLVVERQTT